MRRLLLRHSAAPLTLVFAIACSTGKAPGTGDEPGVGGTGAGAAGGAGGSAATGAGSAGGGAAGKSAAGGTAGTATTAGGAGGAGGSTTGGTAGTVATSGGAGGASGTGGSAGVAGTAGQGGGAGTGGSAGEMAMGGTAGDAVGSGGMGAAGAANAGGAGGGAPACPPAALFCSGFEDAGLPTGATYLSSNDNNDPSKGLAFDKTVFHSGAQSVEVLKIASYAQREIVVPAAKNFWFRAYLRTDVAIGGPMGNNHNLFFEAAWAGSDKGIEIVEEDCELGMNIMDSRYGSNGTVNQPGCPTSAPLGMQVTADAWHCFEGHFDGGTGNVELYVDSTLALSQMGLAGAKQNFSTLRFGYRHYHERQRLVWYDDVVTAADRIGCP